MANVEKMIKGVSEQIGATLKGLMEQYKDGKITKQQVLARSQKDVEAFINSVRPSRNKEGQVSVFGILSPTQFQMLQDIIAESKLDKFIEFQQEPAEEGRLSVQITVLAAGAELFRDSLKDGKLHLWEVG